MSLLSVLEPILHIPTAPYREQWMIDHVVAKLKTLDGVDVQCDRWGNIIARLKRGNAPRTVAYVAHLDHPGFLVAGDVNSDGLLPVNFEGGVHDDYFMTKSIRLFRSADDPGIRAEIVELSSRGEDGERNRIGLAKPESDPTGCTLGMWDLDPMRIEDGLIHSRALDDIAGVAMTLATFERLAKSSKPTDTIALFSRAEETGYHGTLLFLQDEERSKFIPDDAHVIVIEMSSERPNTPIGGGAVLRVGDRTLVYDNAINRGLFLTSQRLAKEEERRPLVRALMDGGTCETTAFLAFGIPAGGLCLPLGNYHNMDAATQTISEECISLADAEDLVAVMTAYALEQSADSDPIGDLRKRFLDNTAAIMRRFESAGG